MSKFKIVNLFDKLFITISIFLIVYAWINFYIRDLWTTFLLSLIFSFGLVFLLFYALNRKHKKITNSKQLIKDIENSFLAFSLMTKDEQLVLLKSLQKEPEKCKIKNEVLLIGEDTQLTQVVVLTHLQKLTQQDLIFAIQNLEKDVQVLKIFCNEKEANLNTFLLRDLNIEIVTKSQIYTDYFNANKTYPDCSKLTQNNQPKFSQIIKSIFMPNKSKSYFCCGLILIFSSIILPYHYYYLIFGSTLLMFSIICKLQQYIKD